ncbi:N-formylglutamate deformylase [Aliiroseovarius halocynthiae]|uniref:N-formylglutamate amidohydrolase n=1 Tax=Aliiroseovarius halocynthiae TaxID=985055 RepID=A0A545SP63_9RHOB|nr:N-formylglutamate amidohydrolase [Aliiroseovarius halocynthiae]TQV66751.1 N-formylglutamate amidohydrolase [Aliiroseovarius halocynthiae]SMR82424.1 N-formylglutamate deformylase [Aliiroseovarius halocynthiae]
MRDQTFSVYHPRSRDTSVVFASPHSGRYYDDAFLKQTILDERSIRSSEDAYVDRLYAFATECGAPFLCANTPRAYVDLNRGLEELDPALISGLRGTTLNPRISSGLGVIPRVVAGGRTIYRGKMTLGAAQKRLNAHWHPYHTKLRQLMDDSLTQHGQAILVDCHSMPHEALASLRRKSSDTPEIVLGDRFGTSAGVEIVDAIEAAFQGAGFRTARNMPFAGAFMAQHYGRPQMGRHVVQIEIDRSLYMDEASITPNYRFTEIQNRLRAVIARIADVGRSNAALAAE